MFASNHDTHPIIIQDHLGSLCGVPNFFLYHWQRRVRGRRPDVDLHGVWKIYTIPDTSIPVGVELWGVGIEKNLLTDFSWEG